MKLSLTGYSILALGTANMTIFINLWSVLGEYNPMPVVERHTETAPTPELDIVVSTFEKVVRHSDISVTHLFGPLSSEEPERRALAETAQETEPNLRLIGVISNDNNVEEQIVVLDRSGSTGIMRLRLGSKITPQGWLVNRITPRSVELLRGKERKELFLE